MTSRLIQNFAILALVSLVAGCKFTIIAPSGGHVWPISGSRYCTAGNICEFDIQHQALYGEFLAVAQPGYVFTKWNAGPGFLCGNSTDPRCYFSMPAPGQGNAAIDAVYGGGQHVYIMPIFNYVGLDTDRDGTNDNQDQDDDGDGIYDVDDDCPLNPQTNPLPSCALSIADADIINADGKEWAQVDLFVGAYAVEIFDVCPSGPCIAGRTLRGYDMTGWTWASDQDVLSLFNFYGADLLTYVTQQVVDPAFLTNYYNAGWRPPLAGVERSLAFPYIDAYNTTVEGELYEKNRITSVFYSYGAGAWFYRSSQ